MEKGIIAMLYQLDEKQILLDYIESEKYENSKEIAVKMLREGNFSVEQIAGYISNLTTDDVKRIQQELLQNV